MRLRRHVGMLALSIVLSAAIPAYATWDRTDYGHILTYGTGWYDDVVRVVTTAPIKNPAVCPTPDGFMVDATDPAKRTHQAALLAAFLSDRQVQLVLDGATCVQGRPRIVGIYVR